MSSFIETISLREEYLYFSWISSSDYFVIFHTLEYVKTQTFFCEPKPSQTWKLTESRSLILWTSAQLLNEKCSATCPLTCWLLNTTFSWLNTQYEVLLFFKLTLTEVKMCFRHFKVHLYGILFFHKDYNCKKFTLACIN